MRESIGNAFVVNFILVFVIIFIGLLATSSSYSKAAKVKNTVMDIVEKYADELDESNQLPSEVSREIETNLARLGYRLNENKNNRCDEQLKKMDPQGNTNIQIMNQFSNYHYCVFKHPQSKDNTKDNGSAPKRGNYYIVVTYMYFDIPVIGSHFELPVKGQTRTYFDKVKYNG